MAPKCNTPVTVVVQVRFVADQYPPESIEGDRRADEISTAVELAVESMKLDGFYGGSVTVEEYSEIPAA